MSIKITTDDFSLISLKRGKKSTVLILLNHIFPNKQDAFLTFKNYSKLHIKKYCELFLKF